MRLETGRDGGNIAVRPSNLGTKGHGNKFFHTQNIYERKQLIIIINEFKLKRINRRNKYFGAKNLLSKVNKKNNRGKVK